MYVIQDNKSGKVVYIDYTSSAAPRAGREVYAGFDEKTMDIGWTDKTYIPASFTIDKNGKIVELRLEEAVQAGHFQLAPDQKVEKGKIVSKTKSELIREGILKLEDVKKNAKEYYSAMAFAKRSRLLPDYKLQNAALGIYTDDVNEAYHATVKAFRDEFYRIQGEIEKAKNIEAVEAVKAHYPESIVSGNKVKKEEKKAEKKQEVKKEAAKEMKKQPTRKVKKASKKKQQNKLSRQRKA